MVHLIGRPRSDSRLTGLTRGLLGSQGDWAAVRLGSNAAAHVYMHCHLPHTQPVAALAVAQGFAELCFASCCYPAPLMPRPTSLIAVLFALLLCAAGTLRAAPDAPAGDAVLQLLQERGLLAAAERVEASPMVQQMRDTASDLECRP